MISQKVIDYFKQKNPNVDIKTIFQDFTDEEIKKAIQEKQPKSFEELVNYLFSQTSNEEIRCHLKGYESCLDKRQRMIEIAKMFSRAGFDKSWIDNWWRSKVDARNPLTDEELEKIMNTKKGGFCE